MQVITPTRETDCDYYEILGVTPDATAEEIKRAYLRAAFQYHPDRNSAAQSAHEKMELINEAYAVISDPVRRREYDLLRGYGVRTPKFNKGSRVRISPDSPSPYRGFIGVVEKEPEKDPFRYWYTVRIESQGLPTVRRFAEEELEKIGD